MDQHGLSRADMVPILGTPSRVSEVLGGKKGLSMAMVQRLAMQQKRDHHARIERRLVPASRELRIDYGPGYRVYFVRRGEDLIVLLAGGTKDTQARDIGQAITLASEL